MNTKLIQDQIQHQKDKDPDQKGSQSEQQQLKQIQEQLRQKIRMKKRERRKNSKMIVGTGFSFDITDFFKFHHHPKMKDGKQLSVFDQISGGHLAWFILFYSVCNAAMIPAWIMSIKASKFLRISWRFFLQSLMLIPFVLYEKRSGNQQIQAKYSLKNILIPKHLGKLYLSGFQTTFWFTIILTCFEWTYISHAMVLGSLSNFFLSLDRSIRGSNHELQPGGQVLVIIGILLVFQDSISLDTQVQSPSSYDVINPFYLNRTWIQRILADITAIGVAFGMSKLSSLTSDLKSYYPPYLSMLLVNIIIFFNMALSAYFFNGATFDTDSRFGIFSIFSQTYFAGFMYMAIILCMGMLFSFVMIAKLFPQPIIPALVMVFEPVVSTFFLNVVGVQGLPGSFACIGYLFIIPGIFLILIGQCMLQRSQKKTQIQQKVRLTRILQLKKQRSLKKILQKKQKTFNEEMNNNRSNKITSQSQNLQQIYQNSPQMFQKKVERRRTTLQMNLQNDQAPKIAPKSKRSIMKAYSVNQNMKFLQKQKIFQDQDIRNSDQD